jgi:uncharacterized protein YbjT (DUF2867 family)
MRQVLITGATGRIGAQLVSRLVAHKWLEVRALVRTPRKAMRPRASGAELVPGSFDDLSTLLAAMDGVDTLVLITPAHPDAADQASAALSAARAAGVRKIVRISAFKAALDAPTEIARQHGRTDLEIRGSGLTYTILRPPFFMQNLCFLAARRLAAEGKLNLGVGDGKLAMIDARDLVESVEQAVLTDTYDDQVLTLTGPESIGGDDMASRLTRIVGRPVEYVRVTPEGVERSIRALGLGDWYAEAMRDYCIAYSEGWGDVVTGDVTRMTGRSARSFDQFAREILVRELDLAA